MYTGSWDDEVLLGGVFSVGPGGVGNEGTAGSSSGSASVGGGEDMRLDALVGERSSATRSWMLKERSYKLGVGF